MDPDTSIWVEWATRQGFGWVNPNYAAAFFASVALSLWITVFIWKKSFWICLPVSVCLTFFLVLTQSRGGMVGLILGGLILIPFIQGGARKVVLIAAHVLVFGIAAFWISKAGHRIEKGLSGTDDSITNRFVIWEQTPAMMVQSPEGWGFGNAAEAYHQWYQRIGQDYQYKHLVNSHLTWLVEMGWPLRFLYVFFWLAVLWICMPSAGLLELSVALAVWAAFLTTSFFSGVAHFGYQWVIPLAALVGVLVLRWRRRLWPQTWSWTVLAALASMVLLSFYVCGKQKSVLAIEGTRDQVRLGRGNSVLVVLQPSMPVLGEKYGHRIREGIAGLEGELSIYVVPSVSGKMAERAVWILSGALSTEELEKISERRPSALILMNPVMEKDSAVDFPEIPIYVFWGELRQNGDVEFWKTWIQAGERRKLEVIPGSAEYIPSWFTLVQKARKELQESP